MTAIEICLIVVGIAAIIASYFISEKASKEKLEEAAKDLVLSEESKAALLNQTKAAVEDILEGMTDTIAGRAERALEKLSNETLLSVHDYSNTVLGEINKSHNEVMFLYSMLEDKDKELKNTAREVQSTVRAARHMNMELPEPEKTEDKEPVGAPPETIRAEEPSAPPDGEPQEAPKNNNERILKLHKEGKTNLEIARELELGLGEVKLVIDLFQEVSA